VESEVLPSIDASDDDWRSKINPFNK